MSKFMKKPIIINAEQFYINKNITDVLKTEDNKHYVITAHEQIVFLEEGDWIISEINSSDRFYPCKNDIFKETYIAVD